MFERVDWDVTLDRIRGTWVQGQHAVACAPTGRGKTFLLRELMPMRSHVVFFGTKNHDEEYGNLLRSGFTRITQWPPKYGYQNKVLLWPRPEKTIAQTLVKQREVFANALDRIFATGKWTCAFDELHWMAQQLRLFNEIAAMHHQGRSSGLTYVDGFQRPAWVPPVVYSSATHVFSWGTNYREDLKRLTSIAKLDTLTTRELQHTMGNLGQYEFVYVNVRDNKPPIISQVGKRYA
jgi:hypothetical protein